MERREPRNPRHRELLRRFEAGDRSSASVYALAEAMEYNWKTAFKILNEAGYHFRAARPPKPRPQREHPSEFAPQHLGRGAHINYHLMEILLRRGKLSHAEIGKRTRATARTVQRHNERMGLARPHPARTLPSFEERLKLAERMLDEGAPFSEVKRTVHMHRRTLHKYFPGRQWSQDQVSAHALAVRHANEKINTAWNVDNSTRLTLPPYGR